MQSAAIVRSVIALGHALSLPVVAEGVESRVQLEFLASESCNEVQGYLIGKPLPIDDYAGLVGRRLLRHTLDAATAATTSAA